MNWVNGVAAEIDLVVVCGIGGLGLSPVIRINISITFDSVHQSCEDNNGSTYTLRIKSSFIDIRNYELNYYDLKNLTLQSDLA